MLLLLKNNSEVISEIKAFYELKSSSLTANLIVDMNASSLCFLVLQEKETISSKFVLT